MAWADNDQGALEKLSVLCGRHTRPTFLSGTVVRVRPDTNIWRDLGIELSLRELMLFFSGLNYLERFIHRTSMDLKCSEIV